jgi:hypothetical protein
VKSANGGEFVAPSFGVLGESRTHVLPFAAFSKAAWDRTEASEITFPLSGLKIVLDGTGGGREGALIVRDLAAVRGDLSRHETRSYGDAAHPCPVLTVDDPEATPLGRDATSGAVVLVCRASPTRQRYRPRLRPARAAHGLMGEAGVCSVDSARSSCAPTRPHCRAVGGGYDASPRAQSDGR